MTTVLAALSVGLAAGTWFAIRVSEESARIDATLHEVLANLPVHDWDQGLREELQ